MKRKRDILKGPVDKDSSLEKREAAGHSHNDDWSTRDENPSLSSIYYFYLHFHSNPWLEGIYFHVMQSNETRRLDLSTDAESIAQGSKEPKVKI